MTPPPRDPGRSTASVTRGAPAVPAPAGIVPVGTGRAPAGRRQTVLVSGLASDSHTWNLVFLQLLIEELGYDVVNLGPCVPDELLVRECRERTPALLVVSSVNGHGHQDGVRVIRKLRAEPGLAELPAVIGGKLGITGGEGTDHVAELMEAGFDSVFEDGAQEIASFRRFIGGIPRRAALS
ncbi:cobalamin B12-binding domain-containing protein [Streptomyces sp. NPDC021100]|uniref:cobalamin B12-binding domain-containing protein n=1 Tax=Streptomyces sp. NPDC021100 TaxID=3365114 RepID=UPI00379C26BB